MMHRRFFDKICSVFCILFIAIGFPVRADATDRCSGRGKLTLANGSEMACNCRVNNSASSYQYAMDTAGDLHRCNGWHWFPKDRYWSNYGANPCSGWDLKKYNPQDHKKVFALKVNLGDEAFKGSAAGYDVSAEKWKLTSGNGCFLWECMNGKFKGRPNPQCNVPPCPSGQERPEGDEEPDGNSTTKCKPICGETKDAKCVFKLPVNIWVLGDSPCVEGFKISMDDTHVWHKGRCMEKCDKHGGVKQDRTYMEIPM